MKKNTKWKGMGKERVRESERKEKWEWKGWFYCTTLVFIYLPTPPLSGGGDTRSVLSRVQQVEINSFPSEFFFVLLVFFYCGLCVSLQIIAPISWIGWDPSKFITLFSIILTWAIDRLSIVLACGPGDGASSPGRVIPMNLKMVLDGALLNSQHYMVEIKGKMEQSRKRCHPWIKVTNLLILRKKLRLVIVSPF